MSRGEFFCGYCKRHLPGYFVPDGHARVAVICFECHMEQQDINPRKDSKAKEPMVPDRVRKVLTKKMYQAWKLVCVEGLSHEEAARRLGISQQSLSGRLSRAVKVAIMVRGSIIIRGGHEKRAGQDLLHQRRSVG